VFALQDCKERGGVLTNGTSTVSSPDNRDEHYLVDSYDCYLDDSTATTAIGSTDSASSANTIDKTSKNQRSAKSSSNK
jgi:hypothetical protein